MHEIPMGLKFNQRMPYLAAGTGLTILGVVTLTLGQYATSLVPGVILLVGFFLSGRWGAVLTPHGLVAKGFTTRHFAWQEIAHVEVSSFMFTKTVRLTLVDGRRTRLRAPVDSWGSRDPEFPAKATTIWQWWAAATGRTAPYGAPGPQPWPQQGAPQPGMPPQPFPQQQPWPQQPGGFPQQYPSGPQGWPQPQAGQPPYGPPPGP